MNAEDPLGSPALPIMDRNCSGSKWSRPLTNGDVAILVLNRADTLIHTRVDFNSIRPMATPEGAYRVRDVQARKDLGVACGSLGFALQPHQTALVRLTKVNGSCAHPTPPPACTPVPPPGPDACWRNQPCRQCSDGSKPCPFPTPPLPACPRGYSEHASGYWAHADQHRSTGEAFTHTYIYTTCT